MEEVTENPSDKWFTEEDRESLFNANYGSFNDWLATQPDTPIFVTEEEAKDYYGQDTGLPVVLHQEHTVKVDLWYIVPDYYQWFARDVSGNCIISSEKPMFDEAEGVWYNSTHSFALEVTDFKNVIFPDSNLEERPNREKPL